MFAALELFQGHPFRAEADVDEVLHTFGCVLLLEQLIRRPEHRQALDTALKQLLDIKQCTHSACECSHTERLGDGSKLCCVSTRTFNFLPRFFFLTEVVESWGKGKKNSSEQRERLKKGGGKSGAKERKRKG